jgi:hypothetical protein
MLRGTLVFRASQTLFAVKGELPLSYRWFRANGLKRLVPWHFGDDPAFIEAWRRESVLETDGHDIMPFAFRPDQDRMAGFVVIDGMIHDPVFTADLSFDGKKDIPRLRRGDKTASLDVARLPCFVEWLKTIMLSDTVEWMNEADLAEIKAGTWPNFAR